MYQTKIKIGKYKGVEVKKFDVSVSEEELAAELERARTYAASTVDKEDGITAMGDQVVIDFVGYIDDKPFEGGSGEGYPLTLGSNTFIPGFEEQLVGVKVGDQVDVKVPFPKDYHAAEYAGKDAVFKCTIKSLRATIIPELSDEIVSKISNCKTLDEFRVYVRTQILNAKTIDAQQAKENAILEYIVEHSEIDVPKELVVERQEEMVNSLEGQLRGSGNTLEQYLDYSHITKEEFLEDTLRQALEMLKGQAVLGEVANQEGFKPEEKEIEAYYFEMSKAYQMDMDELKQMMGERGLEMIKQDVVNRKALEFIAKEAIEVE